MTSKSSLKIVKSGKASGVALGSNLSRNLGNETPAITDYQGNACVVTLGCAKNQVDSEVMLGVLKASGYSIVSDVELAEVVVVNTCGFLQSAVEESISTILEIAALKKSKTVAGQTIGGRLRKLIVVGCMVERYRQGLVDEMPEVDAFLTTNDITQVASIAQGDNVTFTDLLSESRRPYFLYDETSPRILGDARHSAYVKISEGCDRPCTFCIIPKIRGAYRCRTLESIVAEANNLATGGVKEIILVAQDLTAYNDNGRDLVDLLAELIKIAELGWIRLLYAYPLGITEKLLTFLESDQSGKLCKYVDIPLQHASDSVLKRMKRPRGQYSPQSVVDKFRLFAPSLKVRTTFIVGFPGETEEDIAELEKFVLESKFSSVGVFTYSNEIESGAYNLEDQIAEQIKVKRKDRILAAQAKVVANMQEEYLDKELTVMVDDLQGEVVVARAEFQAPEVDGEILINDSEVPLTVGGFYRARISKVLGYDLLGEIVGHGSGELLGQLASEGVV